MIVIFYFLSIVYGVYFLFYRRKIDYTLVAYFSSLIYFLPGYFGYSSYLVEGYWKEIPIIDEVYLVYIVVISCIFFFSFYQDLLFLLLKKNNRNIKKNRNYEITILFFLASFGLILMLKDTGQLLFVADKQIVLDSLTRSHILFYSATMIGIIITFTEKNKFYFWIFICYILFNTYIGFRSNLAIVLLSILLIYFGSKGTLNFKLLLKLILIAGLLGFFMLFYKTVGHAVKSGNWELVFERLTSLNHYKTLLEKSEPFVTQTNLNIIMTENYSTPIDHVTSIVNQFLLFSDKLYINTKNFNDYFQPALFPKVNYGMDSNIWAQMWSAGGWLLLFFFILIFNVVIVIANYTFYFFDKFYSSVLTPIFLYWSFYLHRSDITYLLNLQKRIFLVLFVAILGATLFRNIYHFVIVPKQNRN